MLLLHRVYAYLRDAKNIDYLRAGKVQLEVYAFLNS